MYIKITLFKSNTTGKKKLKKGDTKWRGFGVLDRAEFVFTSGGSAFITIDIRANIVSCVPLLLPPFPYLTDLPSVKGVITRGSSCQVE